MTIVLQGITPKISESAHVYRQILATFAASLLSVSAGLTFGFTAVLLPKLQTDPNYPYEEFLDSWIASISPLAMTLGSLFAGSMSDGIGRKMGQLVLIVPFTLGWIIMGIANNNVVMLIGRFITGVCTGSVRSNSMVYIGELSDPKYRGAALFCPSAAIHIGVIISHLIGKYCDWKVSCYLFTVPNIVAFLILVFLKESPLWLLSKGRLDEGVESYKQFRGTGEAAEKELAKIMEKTEDLREEKTTFKDLISIIFSKPFMMAMTTIILLFVSSQWCGINTISFYAEVIFEKTFSGGVDAFMLMLVTDALRIAAAIFICMFANALPRKITFEVCSVFTTLSLIGLVIYLYLEPVGLLWVAMTCMVIYIAMASALTSIAWSFVVEIFPAKVRGFSSGLGSAVSYILLFVSVKLTPEIMNNFGDELMYVSFAAITFITGVILYFILPETNGRSLQDIEETLYNKDDEKKDIRMGTMPESSA